MLAHELRPWDIFKNGDGEPFRVISKEPKERIYGWIVLCQSLVAPFSAAEITFQKYQHVRILN